MPTFNAAPFVGEAVGSVLADMEESGVDDFKLLIANDASTDDTSGVLQAYENHPNVDVITNSQNLGLGGVHRLLMDRSLGGVEATFAISFRDSDDISIAGSTKKLLDVLMADESIGLVGGCMLEFFDHDTETTIQHHRYNGMDKILADLMRGHMPSWNPTSIVSSRAIINAGIEYPVTTFADDLLFQAQLVFSGVGVTNIVDPVVMYRKHSSSATTGWRPGNAWPYLQACREIWNTSPEYQPTVSDIAMVYAHAANILALSPQSRTHRAAASIFRMVIPADLG